MNEARLDQIPSNVFTQQAAVIKTMLFKGSFCIFIQIIVSPDRRVCMSRSESSRDNFFQFCALNSRPKLYL